MSFALLDTVIQHWNETNQRILPDFYLGNRWLEIGLFAGCFAVLVLLPMRISRLSKAFRTSRRMMMAHAYEILLFRKRPRAVMRAEMALVGRNVQCISLLLPSLLMGGVLWLFLSDMLKNRYAHAPCRIDENIVLRSEPLSEIDSSQQDNELTPDISCFDVTASVRNTKRKTSWLRVRPRHNGVHAITTCSFLPGPNLNVGVSGSPAQPNQIRNGVHYRVSYPLDTWWGEQSRYLWVFFGASLLLAIPLARVFGIEM